MRYWINALKGSYSMTSQIIFFSVTWLPWKPNISSKHTNNVMIIAIKATKGTTHIYITLSFELHIGLNIWASEMNAKFENIL